MTISILSNSRACGPGHPSRTTRMTILLATCLFVNPFSAVPVVPVVPSPRTETLYQKYGHRIYFQVRLAAQRFHRYRKDNREWLLEHHHVEDTVKDTVKDGVNTVKDTVATVKDTVTNHVKDDYWNTPSDKVKDDYRNTPSATPSDWNIDIPSDPYSQMEAGMLSWICSGLKGTVGTANGLEVEDESENRPSSVSLIGPWRNNRHTRTASHIDTDQSFSAHESVTPIEEMTPSPSEIKHCKERIVDFWSRDFSRVSREVLDLLGIDEEALIDPNTSTEQTAADDNYSEEEGKQGVTESFFMKTMKKEQLENGKENGKKQLPPNRFHKPLHRTSSPEVHNGYESIFNTPIRSINHTPDFLHKRFLKTREEWEKKCSNFSLNFARQIPECRKLESDMRGLENYLEKEDGDFFELQRTLLNPFYWLSDEVEGDIVSHGIIMRAVLEAVKGLREYEKNSTKASEDENDNTTSPSVSTASQTASEDENKTASEHKKSKKWHLFISIIALTIETAGMKAKFVRRQFWEKSCERAVTAVMRRERVADIDEENSGKENNGDESKFSSVDSGSKFSSGDSGSKFSSVEVDSDSGSKGSKAVDTNDINMSICSKETYLSYLNKWKHTGNEKHYDILKESFTYEIHLMYQVMKIDIDGVEREASKRNNGSKRDNSTVGTSSRGSKRDTDNSLSSNSSSGSPQEDNIDSPIVFVPGKGTRGLLQFFIEPLESFYNPPTETQSAEKIVENMKEKAQALQSEEERLLAFFHGAIYGAQDASIGSNGDVEHRGANVDLSGPNERRAVLVPNESEANKRANDTLSEILSPLPFGASIVFTRPVCFLKTVMFKAVMERFRFPVWLVSIEAPGHLYALVEKHGPGHLYTSYVESKALGFEKADYESKSNDSNNNDSKSNEIAILDFFTIVDIQQDAMVNFGQYGGLLPYSNENTKNWASNFASAQIVDLLDKDMEGLEVKLLAMKSISSHKRNMGRGKREKVSSYGSVASSSVLPSVLEENKAVVGAGVVQFKGEFRGGFLTSNHNSPSNSPTTRMTPQGPEERDSPVQLRAPARAPPTISKMTFRRFTSFFPKHLPDRTPVRTPIPVWGLPKPVDHHDHEVATNNIASALSDKSSAHSLERDENSLHSLDPHSLDKIDINYLHQILKTLSSLYIPVAKNLDQESAQKLNATHIQEVSSWVGMAREIPVMRNQLQKMNSWMIVNALHNADWQVVRQNVYEF